MLRAARWMAGSVVCVALGCSTGPSATETAQIGLGITSPQALLDELDSVTLFVVAASAGATCDPSTGMVESAQGVSGLVPVDLGQTDVVQAQLGRTMPGGGPCPDGGVFCTGEVILPIDPGKPLVFQVVGYRQNAAHGVGCATAAVATDPFQVKMTLLRYAPPAVCGDGALGIGEQCEGSGGPPATDDPVCDSSCRTKEVLLSADNLGPSSKSITNAPPQSKKSVALAWSLAPGATNPNPFHAVFQDTNFAPESGPEINYRQMSQDLLPIAAPALLGAQVRLPKKGAVTPGFDQRARTQGAPAIGALTDGSFLVAYEDDRSSSTGQVNISMTYISADAAQPEDDVVYINSLGLNECSSPAVAGGPQGRALVVWSDNAAQRIRGRIWAPSGWVSSSELSLSTQAGAQPKVAGWDGGWIVAWQGASAGDANDIIVRQVSATGALPSPFVVNESPVGVQDQPSVGALSTGEFIVAWRDGSNIMVQRFDAAAGRIAGDQSGPINEATSAGAGERPSVAGSSLAGGFFVAAWQTSGGDIRGRLLSAAGTFLPNSVDGQDTSFLVNDPTIDGQRAAPAITIGGAGHIVFAWQDDSTAHPGIYARRFPLPVQ